ncbi:MAG TPA: hypothetical protein PLG17_00235 [Thermodesulfobacteriota bacterium]|nr:hypothetical protein [Deltaproteobacteria bacterium]HNR11935.1 hypothetical protein [Thermodesulfobacteriota bacterium]HNU71062.1 hypothetical protein [Thermodesulfobacteriota bacterium]HOC39418.1 hypothetical protein [Thermodesulfobacteriota bacterium]HQO76916.1 hypothetical protein [Thermodesulfobacteriota bacterium]
MEEFFFHDIFASKNIDYLLAIVSLLALIPFWKMLAGKEPAPAESPRTIHIKKR